MFLPLVLILSAATASTPGSAPIVVSRGLTLEGTPSAATSAEAFAGAAEAYGAYLERRLGEEGLQVVPTTTLAARAGAERWGELRRCDPAQAGCRTSLAGLAGGDAVMTGVLTVSPGGLQASVRVLRLDTGRLLAEETVTSVGRFDLTRGLSAAAERLAAQVGSALQVPVSRPLSLSRLSVVPLGVGVVAAGVSTAFFVGAHGKYRALGNEPERNTLTFTEAQELRRAGESRQRLGAVFAGVAGASLVGAVVLYYLGKEERPGLITHVAVDPAQRTLLLSGELP